MKTVEECITSSWNEVCSHVNHATVFMDNKAAELLHWHGGLLQLTKAGALDVKEFSSFESGGPNQKKAVFIITSVLEGTTRDILRDIIRASHFQYVVVITTVTEVIHSYCQTGVMAEDTDFFSLVEERLQEWMGNMNYTAEVFYVPLLTLSLDNSVFLTPTFAGLFPLLNTDLHQVELQYRNKKADVRNFDSLKSLDMNCLPQDLQLYYKTFISSINGLLTELCVREDIYSVGYTSSILATELEAFPLARNRRKEMTDRVSLVFVDRTLDLASPVAHNTETLMDRLVQLLPRLPGHKTDVRVNMAPLCNVDSETGSEMISPGCLATQSGSQTLLHTLITGKQKEGLMEVNRQLVEAAAQSKLPLSLKGRPTRVTAEQLQTVLQLFKGKYKTIVNHLDAVQVAMAICEALQNPRMHHLDELISVEKGLIQNISDTDGLSALSQVVQLLERKDELGKWSFSLDDILFMLVFTFSLSGTSLIKAKESHIKDALVTRIMAEKDCLSDLVKDIVASAVADRSIVDDIVEDMMKKLLAIASSREHLHQFDSILDPGSSISPASLSPLCRQVIEAIFDTEKKDLMDVEHKSSGLKDILKSGFGLFRTVAKPRPSDHPLLILFVVGGVTSTEVKQIKDVVNHIKPSNQVIVGSTRLLSPQDIIRSVFCENNVNMVSSKQ